MLEHRAQWREPMPTGQAEKTAAMLVRGIERRSRTIITPAARLTLLTPTVFQLGLEGLARRHRWATTIREQEQADAGRDV